MSSRFVSLTSAHRQVALAKYHFPTQYELTQPARHVILNPKGTSIHQDALTSNRTGRGDHGSGNATTDGDVSGLDNRIAEDACGAITGPSQMLHPAEHEDSMPLCVDPATAAQNVMAALARIAPLGPPPVNPQNTHRHTDTQTQTHTPIEWTTRAHTHSHALAHTHTYTHELQRWSLQTSYVKYMLLICAPGSTNTAGLCSREHKHCLSVLPGAQILLHCAPGSTLQQYLCSWEHRQAAYI